MDLFHHDAIMCQEHWEQCTVKLVSLPCKSERLIIIIICDLDGISSAMHKQTQRYEAHEKVDSTILQTLTPKKKEKNEYTNTTQWIQNRSIKMNKHNACTLRALDWNKSLVVAGPNSKMTDVPKKILEAWAAKFLTPIDPCRCQNHYVFSEWVGVVFSLLPLYHALYDM